MDPQWQAYQDPSMGRPPQFNNGLASHPPQLNAKYGAQPQQSQPPAGYTYETYQTPTAAAKAPTMGSNSKAISMASSPAATPRGQDYVTDADTPMEDADPYNRSKYPVRPSHHSRASSQYLASEESSAARKYSPMNVLSPSRPYNASPGKSQNSYGAPPPAANNSRQSPTRTNNYASPPQAYQSPPCKFSPSSSFSSCFPISRLTSGYCSSFTTSSAPSSTAHGDEPGPILSAVCGRSAWHCVRTGREVTTACFPAQYDAKASPRTRSGT